MNKYEIWDHWTKLGEAEGYTHNHAIQEFRRINGGGWIKMFAYEAQRLQYRPKPSTQYANGSHRS